MRHVWIINHYANGPDDPGGTRHAALARNLGAHGWKATIIAASTEHPAGRQRLAPGEKSAYEVLDGVPFLRLRARKYSGNSLARILNIVDFTRALLRPELLADLDPPDLVLGSTFHPLAAWAARRLAQRHGVPFVFEVRDLWPQTLVDIGRLSPRHPVALVLRRLEASLYRDAARIVVLMPGAPVYIRPLGIPDEKIIWLPNGVDASRFDPALPDGDRAGFTLMYFGAHGLANGLDTLIEAMRLVESDAAGKQITLRMIGDGPAKRGLIAKAEELGLQSVRFEEPVPKSAIPALAREADAFVICVRNMPGLYRFGISMNKLFDYMAAGRPTIIGVDASNNPINEAGAGLTVPPDDAEALAGAILRLTALPEQDRRAMGCAARRHVEANYSTNLLAERLAETLHAAVNDIES